MKVKVAINILEKANPEAVMILHNRECARKVVNVLMSEDKSVVWFEDYSDKSKHLCLKKLQINEIISLLKTFNPEAELKFHSKNGPNVYFINVYAPFETYVLVEGEYDVCMQSAIAVMFYDLQYHDDVTNIDIYKDLLDFGIDVEMMRKYCGDLDAEIMERVCKEHSLL